MAGRKQKSAGRIRPALRRAGGVVCVFLGANQVVYAGPGFADAVSAAGASYRVPTYFAHSPSGLRAATVPAEAAAVYANAGGYPATHTGKALRKFIDPLPLLGTPSTMADGTTVRYIPVATPQKWVNPAGVTTADDYYELAVIEYTQKMHSDLKKPTTLRGYVQLSTAAVPGKLIPLTYPDGTAILIQDTNANGTLKFDANGKAVMKQALAVDNPNYLGPAIVSTKGIPTRIKFHNLLPVGRAVLQAGANGAPAVDAFGQVIVSKRNGDLFLPVDTSLMGAGMGPDGINTYTQNRTAIHLHGGDTPWISDGTPHQWWTPAGEADATKAGSLASTITDAAILPQYLRGASATNVPDMPEPGAGAMTLYYPNGQSSRLLWYHDHAAGMTRLNAYAGMAAPYVVTDAVEQDLITRGVIPAATETIPLVLQEKGFVPDDIALQDARWNTTAWGAPGDLWFPHVYETVQDPAQANGWNTVGRWHYGPWFWPVFPALYPLPSGAYGDVTTTPEAWTDTPLVNGVAYPTLTVQPKAYRLRILNGSNDRMMTFNLFQADAAAPFTDPITGATRLTEMKMVPAAVPTNPCPAADLRPSVINGSVCTPATWPTDGRNGGVPDPATVGPTLYQIGSEGGLLPQVAQIEPAPTNPLYDVGRVTVLNVDTSGLFLAPAERADVVVDFSAYAGKTLLVYNDMFAPSPAGDPRNDYFTGVGDQSGTGGAESTRAGYGPNTRTLMQIVVANTTPAAAYNVGQLVTELPKAYAASQERPIVAQSAYNKAFGTTWTDAQAYAPIYAGSIKMPQLKFTPGAPGAFDSVSVTNGGSGYVTAPTVTFSGGGATRQATAQATMKATGFVITNVGKGYVVAPTIAIAANGGGGGGAAATATLQVTTVNLTNGGTGYTTVPTVTFSLPQTAGGVQATGRATVVGGRVTAITITNPGAGYTAMPTVAIAAPLAGTRATATATGGIDHITFTSPDPTNPRAAGGGGYTDFSQVIATISPSPLGTVDANATATLTGSVFDVTLVDPGTGYTAMPTIGFSGGSGSGAAATANAGGSILVKQKAIQELFEPTFGRLNATLGNEIPFTSATTQTTIPLGYIDPPSEMISNGETQIWKITHNGVDTHPVHFHLVNVQLLNRVGWDGFISPPQPNELGWKETVKMNPLEDAIVAVRAKKPMLPGFGLPNSIRPLDPTQPIGAPFGFTQVNVNTGMPATVVNAMANFGWEYVWHCHILGHEENDFMRPLVFDAKEGAANTPGTLSATAPANVQGQAYPGINLTWADLATTEYQYLIERAVGATSTTFTTLATIPANSASYVDAQVSALTTYRYRVTAVAANGNGVSNIANATTPGLPPLPPTNVTAVQNTYTTATVTFTDLSSDESSFVVQASADGGVTWTAFATVARTGAATTGTGGAVTATGTIVGGTPYLFRVASSGTYGLSPWVTSQPVATVAAPPAPSTVTATMVNATTVNLTWLDNSTIETAFVVQRSVNGGAFAQVAQVTSTTVAATGGTISLTNTATAGSTVVYRVAAVAPMGNSAWGTSNTLALLVGPVAPTALAATVNSATSVTLNWTDASNNETSFLVEQSVNGGAYTTAGTVTRTAALRTATGGAVSLANVAVAVGNTYVFRVTPYNSTAAGTPASVTVSMVIPPASGLTAVALNGTSAQLNWLDGGNLETGYRVELSTNNTTWTTLTTTAANATTYTATGLTTGVLYYFRVTAVNGTVTSTPVTTTLTVTAPVLPATPTGLTAAAVRAGTTDTVNLSWTDNATNETSYVIQRCLGTAATCSANWVTQATVTVARTAAQTSGVGAVTGSMTGLTRRTNYSFRVVPMNGTTAGTASNIVSLRTP